MKKQITAIELGRIGVYIRREDTHSIYSPVSPASMIRAFWALMRLIEKRKQK